MVDALEPTMGNLSPLAFRIPAPRTHPAVKPQACLNGLGFCFFWWQGSARIRLKPEARTSPTKHARPVNPMPTTFRPDPIEVLGVVVAALSLGALVMFLFFL